MFFILRRICWLTWADLSHVARKSSRFPTRSDTNRAVRATEDDKRLEIFDLGRICVFVFVYSKSKFSHNAAHSPRMLKC